MLVATLDVVPNARAGGARSASPRLDKLCSDKVMTIAATVGNARPVASSPDRATWRGKQCASRPTQMDSGTLLRLAGPLVAAQFLH